MVASPEQQHAPARRLGRWFVLMCSFPLLVLISVYFEAVAGFVSLGHWPIPSVDDPKHIPTAPLHLLSSALLVALVPVMLLTLLLVLVNWRVVSTSKAYQRWLCVSLGGFSLLVVLGRLDPGKVWYWWFD